MRYSTETDLYLYSFSNEKFFFPDVHHSFKFTLIGAQRGEPSDGFWATFRFNPRVAVAPQELTGFLADQENQVYIRLDSLSRFSPDSLSVMEFQAQTDYTVADTIYAEHPLLGDTSCAWWVELDNEFHFTNDRKLLNQHGMGYPLVEGKTINQFDANYGEYHFWVDVDDSSVSTEVRMQLNTYRVAHRRIARTTDARTLIAAVVAPQTACEVNATVALIRGNEDERIKLFVCAVLNSFVLDYIIRYKVSTTLNMFYLYQLPLPRATPGDPIFDAIVPCAARLTCTRPEFADLWQAVMGEAWTPASGVTDPAARQHLRDELDSLVAHLYGLSRAEFAHVLVFPLVFPEDAAGRARKARLLAVFDGMVVTE